MKRHTTRKCNRRLKRVANRKREARINQLFDNLTKIVTRTYYVDGVLTLTVEPTMNFDKMYVDYTISTDKSEISPTVED